MLCYRDKTFCASEVAVHTCGREFTEQDKIDAEKVQLPVAYGNFCKNN